jgi:hypothetical protein
MGILNIFYALMVLLGPWLQTGPAITGPSEGSALKGQVEIRGNVGTAGFISADLSFGYSADPTGTWFLLQSFSQPPAQDLFMLWDTSGLTDGDYRLRLRVFLADGTAPEVVVENLHIRNEAPIATPIPTGTPEPTEDLMPAVEKSPEVPAQGPLETASQVRITPGPLPTNPVEVAPAAVYSIFGRGALLVLVLFAVLGLLLRLRRS